MSDGSIPGGWVWISVSYGRVAIRFAFTPDDRRPLFPKRVRLSEDDWLRATGVDAKDSAGEVVAKGPSTGRTFM
jgi:hypothetical protein